MLLPDRKAIPAPPGPAPARRPQAQHLLNAADHYGVLRLRAVCEETLAAALSLDNAATTLTLAAQHNAGALRDAATLFAARHVVAVMATPGWAHLKAARPELVDAIMHAVATGSLPPPPAASAQHAEEAAGEGSPGPAGGSSGRNVRQRTR